MKDVSHSYINLNAAHAGSAHVLHVLNANKLCTQIFPVESFG